MVPLPVTCVGCPNLCHSLPPSEAGFLAGKLPRSCGSIVQLDSRMRGYTMHIYLWFEGCILFFDITIFICQYKFNQQPKNVVSKKLHNCFTIMRIMAAVGGLADQQIF